MATDMERILERAVETTWRKSMNLKEAQRAMKISLLPLLEAGQECRDSTDVDLPWHLRWDAAKAEALKERT